MISDIRRYLDLKTRADLVTFIQRTFQTVAGGQTYDHNWHIDAIAWNLRLCTSGEVKRLAIMLPPRNLKSICASVAFPAWLLGHDPAFRIVCASYSDNLAEKLALDCRAVMESEWYRRIFPRTRISREKNSRADFMTTARGGRFSTSVGGTLTGRGGNIIIIDDPLKPDDAFSEAKRTAVNEWYDRTVVSRLDDKRTGVIIIIMQRLHLEDLVGHVISKNTTFEWSFLELPAIAQENEYIRIGDKYQIHYRAPGELLHEARESREVLEQLRRQQGSFNFSAQYLQCPLPLEGEIIKWRWFRFCAKPPERTPDDFVLQSWDTASKAGELNDYSVCTTWLVKGNQYYLLDVLRKKLDYPDLHATVIDHALRWFPSAMIIEDQGTGTALIQDLGRIASPGFPMPIAIKPEGDKITRMHTQALKIESGQVHLPEQAPWLEDFRTELLQFPKGRYDDQVDSLSQALGWLGVRSEVSFNWSFLD